MYAGMLSASGMALDGHMMAPFGHMRISACNTGAFHAAEGQCYSEPVCNL